MNADTALQKSKTNSIESNVRNGLMVVIQKGNASEKFYLYFVPSDELKNYDPAGAVKVGLYENLDIAVTIACIGYGAYDSKWKTLNQSYFFALNNFYQ